MSLKRSDKPFWARGMRSATTVVREGSGSEGRGYTWASKQLETYWSHRQMYEAEVCAVGDFRSRR